MHNDGERDVSAHTDAVPQPYTVPLEGGVERHRILIVDDEAAQRASLARALTEGGFTIEEAADAGEALRRSLRDPPDLIVLDLRLPDASGVELAGAFRAVSGTRRTPIVVVTAYTDAAAELDPKRFGAECVLTKPVSDEDLRAAVRRCFTRPSEDDDEL